MPSAPVEAVLFDLGDTLIQYGDVDKSALFREAARRTYGEWASRQRRMPDFRRYYLHQAFAMWWGYLKLLVRRREMDALRLLRRSSRKLMLEAPSPEDAFFMELAWRWYEPLAEVATLEPRTAAVLRVLRRRGLKLGIVSNTFVPGEVLDRHLAALGLLRFFPMRVYSCDAGYRKPHGAIFAAAAERLGVAAERVVFVGDTYDADVTGAMRAGMVPVWKRHAMNAGQANRDGVASVRTLAELPELLAAMQGARRDRDELAAGRVTSPAPTGRQSPTGSSVDSGESRTMRGAGVTGR